jgi:hypothetical protein
MKVKLCVVCDKPLTRRPGIIKMANGKNRPVESATNFHLRQTCDDACYDEATAMAWSAKRGILHTPTPPLWDSPAGAGPRGLARLWR